MKLDEYSTKELKKELANRKIKREEIVIEKLASCPQDMLPREDRVNNFIKVSGNKNVELYFSYIDELEGTLPIEELKDIYKAISDIQIFTFAPDHLAYGTWLTSPYNIAISIHDFKSEWINAFTSTKTFHELVRKLEKFYIEEKHKK